jgi:hypothetical protein
VLLVTVIDINCGQARMFYSLGRHATRDLAHHFEAEESSEGDAGIERDEFERACDELERAGYTLYDRDDAWADFAQHRAMYAGNLNGLARWFAIPPVQWVSDRSLLTLKHSVDHV